MCAICGCSDSASVTITDMRSGKHFHLADGGTPLSEHHHEHHAHEHDHLESRSHSEGRTITLEKELLFRNNQLAERNRGWFSGRNVLALNFMSSPGAGKTTLLERTIRELNVEFSFHVIEGDQATTRDAERIRACGCPVLQINTGAGCHLDATMIEAAVRKLNPPMDSTLLIENVGNLVCPALFDLGERARVVVASVTEGDDKPAKYPHIFRSADAVLLNKIDLLPHVEFDQERFSGFLRQLNPKVCLLPISAKTGEGLQAWRAWLGEMRSGIIA